MKEDPLKIHYLSDIGLEVRNPISISRTIGEAPEMYRIRIYNRYWWLGWLLWPIWVLAWPFTIVIGFGVSFGLAGLYVYLTGNQPHPVLGVPIGAIGAMVIALLFMLMTLLREAIPSPRRYLTQYQYKP